MRQSINRKKLLCLLILALLAAVGYMTIGVKFANSKLASYAMRIRTPKLLAMLVTAYAIGAASIVFQSIINNTIVTPCLLGMNALYTLIHTAVFFCRRFGKLSGNTCQRFLYGRSAGDGRRRDSHIRIFVSQDQPQCALCAADRYGFNFVFFKRTDHDDSHDGS